MVTQLKKGDKVYLLTKNLTIIKKIKKLNYIKIKSILIIDKKGKIS